MKRADVQQLFQRMKAATAELDLLRLGDGPDWEGELGAHTPEPEPPAPQGGPTEEVRRGIKDKSWAWRKRSR